MKFLHIGDLHLGRQLGKFDLIDDQRFILDQIIDIAENQKVDAVVIAGDVYDKQTPSEEAVKLLDYFLCKLACQGIRIYAISGNHDSAERLAFGSKLLENSELYIAAKYEGSIKCCQFQDEFGTVNLYLLPYLKTSQVKYHYREEADQIKSYNDAARVLVDHMGLDKTKRNVLVAHQFVSGDKDPRMAGSEVIHDITVGTLAKIYADVLQDFDYVALGHIHFPQQVGKGNIWYSGSPLKYSLSEAQQEKVLLLVSIGEKTADGEFVKVDKIPLKPMRDLRHITGKLEDLLAKDNVTDVNDFIYATLTDEKLDDNYMGILRQTYPNTVSVDFKEDKKDSKEEFVAAGKSMHKSFRELVEGYYKTLSGNDISQEEWDVLLELAKEVNAENSDSIDLTEVAMDETN